MSLVFRNAPLQEMLVELRWTADLSLMAGQIAHDDGATSASVTDPFEQSMPFLNALDAALAECGYLHVTHFPMADWRVGDVPLRRWRQPNDPTVAIQAGLGVYSIHGSPPYQSWKAFRSRVSVRCRRLWW